MKEFIKKNGQKVVYRNGITKSRYAMKEASGHLTNKNSTMMTLQNK